MIDALIRGRLHGVATERTAKNGSRFATVKVRVTARDGESIFVNVRNRAAHTGGFFKCRIADGVVAQRLSFATAVFGIRSSLNTAELGLVTDDCADEVYASRRNTPWVSNRP